MRACIHNAATLLATSVALAFAGFAPGAPLQLAACALTDSPETEVAVVKGACRAVAACRAAVVDVQNEETASGSCLLQASQPKRTLAKAPHDAGQPRSEPGHKVALRKPWSAVPDARQRISNAVANVKGALRKSVVVNLPDCDNVTTFHVGVRTSLSIHGRPQHELPGLLYLHPPPMSLQVSSSTRSAGMLRGSGLSPTMLIAVLGLAVVVLVAGFCMGGPSDWHGRDCHPGRHAVPSLGPPTPVQPTTYTPTNKQTRQRPCC